MASLTPRQTSRNLDGKPTRVFLQTFADRVLVLVTQMGKVGNLCRIEQRLQIQATLPASAVLIPPPLTDPSQPNKLVLPEPPPALQLTTLLGSSPSPHQQTLHSLYASQIATIIWTEESQNGLESLRRSVIVGLALYPSAKQQENNTGEGEREDFEGVMSMVYELFRS